MKKLTAFIEKKTPVFQKFSLSFLALMLLTHISAEASKLMDFYDQVLIPLRNDFLIIVIALASLGIGIAFIFRLRDAGKWIVGILIGLLIIAYAPEIFGDILGISI